MNILIIDSHPVYIEGLEVILKRIDPSCHTISASSLSEGLKTLDESRQSIELLIVGINGQFLDEINHLEVLIKLDSKIAIIVLTATNDCRQLKKMLEIGIRCVVPKFFPTEKMIFAFSECCKGHVYVPAEAQSMLNQLEIKDLAQKRMTNLLHLTKRQLQVLEMIEDRRSNSDIADKLSVSLATVKTHINKLYSALDVCGRKECIQRCYDLGVLYHTERSHI